MTILEAFRAPLKRDRLLISLHNPAGTAGRGGRLPSYRERRQHTSNQHNQPKADEIDDRQYEKLG